MSSPAEQLGIAVAVDGSPASEAAVVWAAREGLRRKATVTLLHVTAPVITTWSALPVEPSIVEQQEDSSNKVLEEAEKALRSALGENDTVEVRTESRPSPVVGTLAEASRSATMLVVGNRGTGGHKRLPLGSVAAGLLHHAHCPVVVIHQNDVADSSAPVILGVDGSPSAEAATRFAFEEAALRGVDLVAVHAWSDIGAVPMFGLDWRVYEEEAQVALAERLAGWQQEFPSVQVQRRLVRDRPAHWLIEESQQAQLVVVGSRGRGGFAGLLLGSVASTVAQLSHAPVVVVRK
ncbi:universal stress protein [Mycobacterium sp. AMU20-3851]|uniref:universal stress protein n=1 Tax=Mycobacterium sp. AMU20-3851 TaxID=3122055 RepID=UPI003754F199